MIRGGPRARDRQLYIIRHCTDIAEASEECVTGNAHYVWLRTSWHKQRHHLQRVLPVLPVPVLPVPAFPVLPVLSCGAASALLDGRSPAFLFSSMNAEVE